MLVRIALYVQVTFYLVIYIDYRRTLKFQTLPHWYTDSAVFLFLSFLSKIYHIGAWWSGPGGFRPNPILHSYPSRMLTAQLRLPAARGHTVALSVNALRSLVRKN